MQVYKITNLINGKIYIGKDEGDRIDYMGSGKLIRLAIKKYGLENFRKEIVESINDRELLKERERFWIDHFNATDKSMGYNIHVGGHGGDTITYHPDLSEIRKKVSKAMKGRIITEAHRESLRKNHASKKDPYFREKISARLKGRPKSEEHKRKLSEANKKIAHELSERAKRVNATRDIRWKEKQRATVDGVVNMDKDEFYLWIMNKNLYTTDGRKNSRIVAILRKRNEYDKYYK
jgi:group I intron endonuclease